MKGLFILVLVSMLFSIDLFASGTTGKTDHSKMDHSKVKKEVKKKDGRKALSPAGKKTILAALALNEKLHGAFFNYDGKNIEAAAKKLKIAFDAIEDAEVAKLLKFSGGKLKDIKNGNGLEVNNQNYHIASSALIYIVNKYDVGNDYNAYSCPMVKKKWLQNSKKQPEVSNPYAKSMPHCGSQDSKH